MRTLIYAINLTVDGCCDHTKLMADEEIHEHYARLMQGVDLMVFGRKTYELMVPFWPDVARNLSGPKAMNEFAQAFDSVDKVVFSRTLQSAGAKNARIVRTNLRDEIVRLKQEPGASIWAGGVSLPSQLVELGLVDEYRFVVQPIIAGKGTRLFEGVSLPEKLQLKLLESKILKSGCIALHYLKQ